jgi:glycosyltransferase involved in cell wall biosynthesis
VAQATLHLQLDYELPRELAVGRGTAVFVSGWCFSPQAPVRELTFLLNGAPQPVSAQRMPRLDPFRSLHPHLDPFETTSLTADPDSPQDPLLLSYRSGFWGTVVIEQDHDSAEGWRLELRAELSDGQLVISELATILRAQEPQPVDARGARVVIAMATYEPPRELFERQLESIRAQSYDNWLCVISDDCSSPAAQAMISELIEGDSRFVLARSPRRLGFYGNFERALSLVPADAEFVALADQDDDWHPDKLSTLLGEIGSAQLVYSDARVVSRTGEVLSETWWSQRRNNHEDLLSLLVANAVTGAASLFRRELLDYGLPFPPHQFAHFHDHWLGLTALARGEIVYVQRPLYDYIQHGGASLGHAAANQMTPLLERLRNQREPRERIRLWRLHYFADICRLVQFATVLITRCGEQMAPSKRKTLERFIAADRSPAVLSRMAWRGARELLGTPETLGAEWMLFHALAWRRLLAASARERPQARLRLDALPPSTLIQPPGRRSQPDAVHVIAEKLAPLRWSPTSGAPRRVNLLIPTVDLEHFFGGYIAKFNLARRLAERGWPVRILTVDSTGALPPDWRARLARYGGLEHVLDRVELVFGREAAAIEISSDDTFIATTWWTAHIADDALRHVRSRRFLYLIQEYEPFTFPMGSLAALAEQSYSFPHFALFSSELLRDYFRARGLGVYAGGPDSGDESSLAFENALTTIEAPTEQALSTRSSRRLLFYARPEGHAARNMFELGVLGLDRALARGHLHPGWELNGIGTVTRRSKVELTGGAELNLLPRSEESDYAQLLREHDVGLALMYTPHPSLVPLEMASAGLLTVTNTFETKTAEALTTISSNLIAVTPTIEGVADGLAQAVAGVEDAQRRVKGSSVAWSRDWDESFPDTLIDRVLTPVDPGA